MEKEKDILDMLDLMVQPVFCVKDRKIIKVNPAAQGLLLRENDSIEPLLQTGKEEYDAFCNGCLYLTLCICQQPFGASVTRNGDFTIFVLEEEQDLAELRSMALAARELRDPLNSVMVTASRLFPLETLEKDPQTQKQVARLNRGLYQMLRVISNMSDASRGAATQQEVVNISDFLQEVFAKSEPGVAQSGIRMTFHGLDANIYTLADKEQLERAVLNILSNAMKFTPSGGTIEAALTRQGRTLRLCIQDSGSGIADDIRASLFRRYLRQPELEDPRFGIGLGMVLIRSAAANHGGAVLIDQPEGKGTRVTLTFPIRQNTDTILRAPVLKVDYAAERNHALLELSDCLPASLYQRENLPPDISFSPQNLV